MRTVEVDYDTKEGIQTIRGDLVEDDSLHAILLNPCIVVLTVAGTHQFIDEDAVREVRFYDDKEAK